MNSKLLFTSIVLLSMLLTSVLGLGTQLSAAAAQAPQELPPSVTSDLPDYPPGSIVTLTGANWRGDSTVHIVVDDAVGKTWQHVADAPVNEDGSLQDIFMLPSYFVSDYSVLATGNDTQRVATHAFTDKPAANLDQCANGPVASPVPCTGGDAPSSAWQNGNLNENQAHYLEGESVPYRARLTGTTVGQTYTLTIQYDTTVNGGALSGKHALDYLTDFDRTEGTADPCSGVSGVPSGACALPLTFPIPLDSNVSSAGVTQIGGQNFTIYNGTITGVSAYTLSGDYAGPSSTSIVVTFTSTGGDTIVLAWGGHIATRADWGPNNAAVAISGSPYHMRLNGFTCSNISNCSVGNQDRSLSSGAVIYPASIKIVKDATPDGLTGFDFTASPSPLQNFTLVDDGSATRETLFSNILTFQSYTVSETVLAGWKLTGVVCTVSSPNGGTQTVNSTGVVIDLKEGEDVTCTFSDQLSPVAPSIATTPDPSKGTVGDTLNDSATLSGGNGPTGKITFSLYGPDDTTCKGTPLYTEDVIVSGNGSYSTTTGYSTTKPGTYRWTAAYKGDTYNNPASGGCDDEQVLVAKAKPTITTQASPTSDIVVGTATTVGDSATLSGGYSPSGSVNFVLYSDATCDTAVDGISGSGSIGSGTASYSTSWTPMVPGTYYWIATYAGDDNNDGFTTGCGDDNEQLTVTKAPLTVTTAVHDSNHYEKTNLHVPLGSILHDTASIAGGVEGLALPEVSFTFFTNGACTGAGTAYATDATPAPDSLASVDTNAPTPGSYAFQATVASDGNYIGDTGDCEPFIVDKAQLSVTTAVHDAAHFDTTNVEVPLGSIMHDTASVTGGVDGFALPAVSFKFFTNNACTGEGTAYANDATPSTDTLASIDTAALGPGPYAFQATMATDGNYRGGTSPCEPFSVEQPQLTVTTAVHDAAHFDQTNKHVPLGSVMHDTASVTGLISGFNLPAVSFKFFTNNACTGDGTAIANDGTPAPDTLASVDTAALAAGPYAFQASVASDANYKGDTSECEPFTVDRQQLSVTTAVHNAAHVEKTGLHVPLASVMHDKASVAGGVNGFSLPGVSFRFFTNDACTGEGTAYANDTTPSTDTLASVDTAALGAGGYAFQATVAENSNYLSGPGECEPFTVDKKQLTVTTTVHDASHADITGLSIPLGSTAHDNATVTGGVVGFPIPAISFTIDGSPIANGASEAGFSATSIATGALGAGSHVFSASVAGDGNYLGDTSDPEPFTVAKKQLTVTTAVHDASHADITNTAVPLGSVAHDTASVTGGVSGFSLPAVSFKFFTNGACTGEGTAYANDPTPTPDTLASIDTVALGAGPYAFQATVAADANYKGDTSECEPFSIDKAQLTVTTAVHDAGHTNQTNLHVPLGSIMHDTASVTGGVGSFALPGVSFKFFTNGTCSDTGLAYANDTLPAPDPLASVDTAALGAGPYAFQATVAANSDYFGDVSECEPFTVDKATLTINTTVHDAGHVDITNKSIALGSTAHDNASVAGAVSGFSIPTISFTLDGSPIAKGTAEAGFDATTVSTAPLAAGSHKFVAAVGSNANYVGDTSLDEPFTVEKAQLTITTAVHNVGHADITNTAVPLGSVAHDNASVTGDVAGFPIPAISFVFDGNPIANGTTEAGFDATSVGTGALGAGSHVFSASVAGNSNYYGDTSEDEPFSVDRKQLTVTTLVHNAAHADKTNLSVPLGSIMHDTASVAGGVSGFSLPGVSFKFFTNGACTGDGTAYGNDPTPTPDTLASIDTAALAAGSYAFQATVGENSNYLGETGSCEPFSVAKAQLTVTTAVHNAAHVDKTNLHVPLGSIMHDTASVTGGVSGFSLPGVSFKFFGNGACTGDSTGYANDTNPAPDPLASIDTPALVPGPYAFQATVAGNDNYLGATGACEPFTVDKGKLTITTTVHNASHMDITNSGVAIGTIAHDNATVEGGVSGFPIPAISFTFNGNPIASGSTEAGFNATSVTTGPLGTGSYVFSASVASDTNYDGDTSDPEPFEVLPESRFTDTSFCPLPADGFRLVFIQDPTYGAANYRLNSTNPGQYYYNVFYMGTPGATVTLNIEVPYPFITQGAVPIQAHSGVTLKTIGGQSCYVPTQSLSGYSVTTEALSPVSASGNQIINFADYTLANKNIGGSTTVGVTGKVPSTGLLYMTIHLDYGFKGTNRWTKGDFDADTLLDDARNTALGGIANGPVTILSPQTYTASFSGGAKDDSQTFQSINVFKKIVGVGGTVSGISTGNPLSGVKVQIYKGTKLVATARTDQDGWYMWQSKWAGVDTPFTVKLPAYGVSKSGVLTAGGFLLVNFTVPG